MSDFILNINDVEINYEIFKRGLVLVSLIGLLLKKATDQATLLGY